MKAIELDRAVREAPVRQSASVGSTPREAMVEVRDLVKQYPGAAEPAVRGVTFDIKRGEIFSLLGPNGAGKTTTISMLSCLLKPTRGDASIGRYSVTKEPARVKGRIGVVPQDLAIYPSLSARQNLNFWGKMHGMGGSELTRRVDELLAQVGLADRADDKVETYSGGMKRRINIAVGLLHRPAVVYLDEPTVGIDPQSRRSILDFIQELNAQGLTVLYTTHYMEEAQELSDRVGIMDQGRLIALGTQAELTRMVGEYDSIRLTLDRIPEGLPQRLGAVPGIREVTREDESLILLATDANAILPELLTLTNREGAHVTRLDIREPNLEAVFLHLTGRALRD